MYLNFLNIMSKNVMTADYISSGLIFQLDGINIGNNAGYWTDLIGGIKFPIGMGKVENGFTFGALKITGDAAINFALTQQNYTIELVCNFYTTNNRHYMFFGGGSSNLHIANVGGYMTVSASNNPRTKKYQVGLPLNLSTISLNYDRCLMNKASVSYSGEDYWSSSGSTASFSFDSGGFAFNGSLCALRIYNRMLSESEMLHNQQIDIARFNIQL